MNMKCVALCALWYSLMLIVICNEQEQQEVADFQIVKDTGNRVTWDQPPDFIPPPDYKGDEFITNFGIASMLDDEHTKSVIKELGVLDGVTITRDLYETFIRKTLMRNNDESDLDFEEFLELFIVSLRTEVPDEFPTSDFGKYTDASLFEKHTNLAMQDHFKMGDLESMRKDIDETMRILNTDKENNLEKLKELNDLAAKLDELHKIGLGKKEDELDENFIKDIHNLTDTTDPVEIEIKEDL